MVRLMKSSRRAGAIAPLAAILMVAMLAMVAFGVDIGYIAVVRSEAQNAADSAALAGAARMLERLKNSPLVDGKPVQNATDLQAVRAVIRDYASRNDVGGEEADVHDEDIQIGYLGNPEAGTLDTSGWPARAYNAVRVVVRRDQQRGSGPLGLFFAKVLGIKRVDIQATATSGFLMGTIQPVGNGPYVNGGLLPFTYQIDEWNAALTANGPGVVTASTGKQVTVTDNYKVDPGSSGVSGVRSGFDGGLEVSMYPGRTTSGNFGTINFSKSKVGNSTSVLRDLIENGPKTDDWPDLPEIMTATSINQIPVNGDPGLSSGMRSALEAIIGQPRILPLYKSVSGTGNNTYYEIVGFAPVVIVDAKLNGSNNSYIRIQPRPMAKGSSIDGSERIAFNLTPTNNPNPLFFGSVGLLR